mmetsp:Transcript_22493/g.30111  ORF Transcript_22493/g.30111 Transcript_22493/m.30111 type:complete len:81 (+) Transcript_22493:1728-1970(+)
MLAVEGCNQIHLYLQRCTMNTKVSTSCTRSTIIHWAKPDKTPEELEESENWNQATVPEVFTTNIVPETEELVTEGYKEED